MNFPQLIKPEDKPPRKPRRLAWLDGYEFAVLASVVILNALAIPAIAVVRQSPAFYIWWAQIGLTASWITWSSSPAPVRYVGALLAIVLCGCSAHSIMAWENETIWMFLWIHAPFVLVVHMLLLPTRLLGWRWHFQDHGCRRQFSLFHVLILVAAWGALLGYLRWENGGDLVGSILGIAKWIVYALLIAQVAWLVIARQRKWWLVSVVFVALVIAIWNRMPQSEAHHLLDLEFEPFAMIAIWTLINMGILYLFGLRGSTSRGAVVETEQAMPHV